MILTHLRSTAVRVALVVVVASWALNAGLQLLGFYDRYDAADFDHFTRVTPNDPNYSDRITIVHVDQSDYETLFASKTPLDQGELSCVRDAILSFHPKRLVIDFDTSHWRPVPFKPPPGTDLIWARPARKDDTDPTHIIWTGGVAGTDPPDPNLCVATTALFSELIDNRVRSYSRARTLSSPKTAISLTIPFVAASGYPGGPLVCDSNQADFSPRKIRFVGKNHRIRLIPASLVLRDAYATNDRTLRPYLDKDHIVILGGTYGQTDLYWTPAGEKHGVEILAHAIESEISGGITPFSLSTSLLMDLLLSLGVFIATFRLTPPYDLAAATLTSVLVAFTLGYFLYGYFGLFVGIFPSFLGAPLGIIAEFYVNKLTGASPASKH